MAMQKTGSHFFEVNLLPSEFRHRKLDLSWLSDIRVVWSTFAVIIVAGILFLYYFKILETTNELKSILAQTKDAVAKEQPTLEKIKKLEERQKEIAQKSNALRSIQVSRKRWVILFEDLSTALPPGTWITNITQDGNKMNMNCSTWSFSEVALYMLKLEQKISVTNVVLTNVGAVKIRGEDAYNFSLSVGFDENLGLEVGVQ